MTEKANRTNRAKARTAIFSMPGLKEVELKVANCLLRHINDKSGDCYPGYDRIVEMTELSLSGVRKGIKGLVEARIITVEGPKVTRRTNTYVFNFKFLVSWLEADDAIWFGNESANQPVMSEASRLSQTCEEPVTDVTPNPPGSSIQPPTHPPNNDQRFEVAQLTEVEHETWNGSGHEDEEIQGNELEVYAIANEPSSKRSSRSSDKNFGRSNSNSQSKNSRAMQRMLQSNVHTAGGTKERSFAKTMKKAAENRTTVLFSKLKLWEAQNADALYHRVVAAETLREGSGEQIITNLQSNLFANTRITPPFAHAAE